MVRWVTVKRKEGRERVRYSGEKYIWECGNVEMWKCSKGDGKGIKSWAYKADRTFPTDITVQQTLENIDGEVGSITLGGTANVTLRYGTSANGRGFEGRVIVPARRCCWGRMNG